MVTPKEVEHQLKRLGVKFRFMGRAELKELPHILMPGEQITNIVNGYYDGGFAVLCVTDCRVLLIDKKPMYLTVEDLRFDMISEVDFNGRMLESNLVIQTTGKRLTFTGFNQQSIRDMCTSIQNRVMELRQNSMQQDQQYQQYQQNQQNQYQQQNQAYQPHLSAPTGPSEPGNVPSFAGRGADTAQQHSGAIASAQSVVRSGVQQLQYRVTNPYTKIPLMMRRRVSRFYGTTN
jgi:hypothetical protein